MDPVAVVQLSPAASAEPSKVDPFSEPEYVTSVPVRTVAFVKLSLGGAVWLKPASEVVKLRISNRNLPLNFIAGKDSK